MLDGGIIQRLLEEKWKTFARVRNTSFFLQKKNIFFNNFLIKIFPQNQFLKRLLILFVHLFFLSISVYLRPATENLSNKLYEENRTDRTSSNEESSPTVGIYSDDNADDEDDDMNVKNIIRYCSEVATLMGVLSYVVFQQGHEIKNQGFAAFVKQLVLTGSIFLRASMLI